jgi:transposase InsO family protein
MNAEIEDFVLKCSVCLQDRDRQTKESLISHEVSSGPWDKVVSDLFCCMGQNYLLVVDYYSNYLEICLLKDTESTTVIKHLKSNFARHGIPKTFISDNGPQYTSLAFKELCKFYDIEHDTSNPEHPKSNGLAESTVKTVKKLTKKAKKTGKDPHLALLAYRSTPTTDWLPSRGNIGCEFRCEPL